MRSTSMAPNRLSTSSASYPVEATESTIGDSGGMYQTVRDALAFRLGADLGILRVEEDRELFLVQLVFVAFGRCNEHRVGVVEHQPDVAQPSDAGFRADRGDPQLHARVAEGAFLGLAGVVVEVDLLVGAAGDAHAPAGAFVDRTGGAGGSARRVEAVFADARQVEHEGLFELELHLVLDALEHRVLVPVLDRTAQVVVPVRAPLGGHGFPRDQGVGPGHREVLLPRRSVQQVLVVVGPRFVVVVDLGHLRVAEDVEQLVEPAAALEAQPAALGDLPAALPFLLVLVLPGVAETRTGLHVVEPHVLGAGAVGPRLFAGDRAGVAADALVEVHHHRHLGHDSHVD